jgi:hypothetical protein
MWRRISTEAQGWREALVLVWAEITWRVGMAACSAAAALLSWSWWHQAWASILLPVAVVVAVALARLRATGRP